MQMRGVNWALTFERHVSESFPMWAEFKADQRLSFRLVLKSSIQYIFRCDVEEEQSEQQGQLLASKASSHQCSSGVEWGGSACLEQQ